MISTACIGISMITGINGAAKFVIAMFMLLFSGLLFAFEASQIYHVESLDNMFKRNFGFMYSAKGKAFYIVL